MEILTYIIMWLSMSGLFAMLLVSNDPYAKARKIAQSAAEQIEILNHKWFESEKAGYDIGMKKAKKTWKNDHAKDWRRSRKKTA